MADGKRGRPAMSEEDKAAARAAREALTPEEKEAAKAARAAKKAGKTEEATPAAPKAEKPPKPAKAASEPKPAKPPKAEAPKRATVRDEPIAMDPNLLTNDQREGVFLSQMRNYDTTEVEVKEAITKAKARLAQARDTAKAAYGKDFLSDRKLYQRFSQPGGRDLVIEMFTGAAFVARTADIVFTRDVMDLFGEDRTPHLDRMFRDGKKAAMSGVGPTAPGNLNGQSASKWTEGWHAGDAEREKMELSFTAQKSAPSDFAKHAPKAEEPKLPIGDPINEAREAGAEAFATGSGSIPPSNLGDEETAAWIEAYNGARDKPPTSAMDWQRQGELAFANGEGNNPPDAVPMNERGSWRAGWNKASSAALQAKRDAAKAPKPDADESEHDGPFEAGAAHRASGGGGAVPDGFDPDDAEAFMDGWRHQDAAIQAERGSSH